MFSLSGRGERPTVEIPLAETHEARAQADEIDAIGQELTALAKARPWNASIIARINGLLDRRNTIRALRVTAPADVPVTPGRPS